MTSSFSFKLLKIVDEYLISYYTGYYRVNYDETNWKLINQQLLQDHRAISELSRCQLIDDSLNIARTGSVPYSIALELSSYLRSESDYAPWLSALTAFNYLDRMLYHTTSKDKLRVKTFYFLNIKFLHKLTSSLNPCRNT
jgi:hypothetical protein